MDHKRLLAIIASAGTLRLGDFLTYQEQDELMNAVGPLIEEVDRWRDTATWWNTACKSAWDSRDAAGVLADTAMADLTAAVEERNRLRARIDSALLKGLPV